MTIGERIKKERRIKYNNINRVNPGNRKDK